MKNAILGSVKNLGSIQIGDQVHNHISSHPNDIEDLKIFKSHQEALDGLGPNKKFLYDEANFDNINSPNSSVIDITRNETKTSEIELLKPTKKTSAESSDVFIMYSWDSEQHKDKVLSFWKTLRENGFNAFFDRQFSQENTAPDFNVMMHKAITDYNKIIIILSEGYKDRANNFIGGVGNEYSMVIKDIDSHPKKYILISFDKITNAIFPAFLKGREVVQISDKSHLEKLFGKLKNVPEFEIPLVSQSKPELKSKEIAPLFNFEGLKVSELRAKSDAGSWQTGNLFERHVQAISIVIINNSSKIIEGFNVKVEIPRNLAKYDPNAEIINNNRIFSIQDNQKLHPDDSAEIHCGETYVSFKDAEEAFKSQIKVVINWDSGKLEKSEFIQPIDGFLFGHTMYGERKLLQLSDFHDKNADIR